MGTAFIFDTTTEAGRAGVRAVLGHLAAPRNPAEAAHHARQRARGAELHRAAPAGRPAIATRHQAENDARLDGLCGPGFAAAVRTKYPAWRNDR